MFVVIKKPKQYEVYKLACLVQAEKAQLKNIFEK